MTITVACIGAGNISGRHLDNLRSMDDVRIVGVADVALERAQEYATRYGCRGYRDYQEMIEREHPEALWICVPPFVHGEPEGYAVAHKLPFFVEKPLATTWEAAEAIAQSVRQAGLITAVGYHWRYLDIVERAQELLQKRPARLALGYWMDSTPPVSWWPKQAQSGGQQVEQTTHIFDLARYLIGDVTKVYGTASRIDRPAFPDADVADVSTATLTFHSGAVAQLASTCLLDYPYRIGLHLFGEGLGLELRESRIYIADGPDSKQEHQTQGDAFVREARTFLDAVRSGDSSAIRATYGEALKTHRITTLATRSAVEGRALAVEATK